MFDDIIADMGSNKRLRRGWKLNILYFMSQSYFKVPKTIRLKHKTHYFIIKISKKNELQQIASKHSFDTDFKDFMKL